MFGISPTVFQPAVFNSYDATMGVIRPPRLGMSAPKSFLLSLGKILERSTLELFFCERVFTLKVIGVSPNNR